MKTFNLFNHQSPKVNETIYALQSGEKVVLSGCPGSGKTEMSFAIIDWAIKFGMKKVLVLAHSTNVLKKNYKERFDSYNFSFAENVTIDIPQNWSKIKGKYDFVIIDEAHQNYLAPMVQRIVQNIPMQLLLTGTPSKLVAKGGFKIVSLAMESVPAEYFSKVQIELVTTPYKWVDTDYGQDGNLKLDTNFDRSETEIAVENVLKALIKRVSMSKVRPETWNQSTFINRLKLFFVKKELNKTMIACSRQPQADLIYNYIKNTLNLNVAVSHAKSDDDSKVFDEFLDNKYDILVVVNRGRLGYSDNDLFNMIDMTGTKNADLTYQMFARVVRGDKSQQKYFIKVAPTGPGMMDLTDITMRMSLSLMFESVVTTFNGKNFNGMFVPVIKKTKNVKVNTKSGNTLKRNTKKFIFPEYTNDIVVQLKELYHDISKDLSIYKKGDVQEILNEYSNRRKLTREVVIDILESGIYENLTDLSKNDINVYFIVKNDELLMNTYFPNRRHIEKGKWNEETIAKAAVGVNNRKEFQSLHRGAIIAARKRYPGLLDKLFGRKLHRYTINKKNPSK